MIYLLASKEDKRFRFRVSDPEHTILVDRLLDAGYKIIPIRDLKYQWDIYWDDPDRAVLKEAFSIENRQELNQFVAEHLV